MSCKKCNKKFNNSKNKPFILLQCFHTVCSECLNKLSEEKCPICKEQITNKQTNLSVLEALNKSTENAHKVFNKKYKFVSDLGAGSFGIVFKVADLTTKIEYALKLITNGKMFQAEIDSSREYLILRKLENEFILKAYETFYEDLAYCILFEYCHGGDLESRISNSNFKNIDENQIKIWINQIINGVFFLHDNKIIHRDLKPANIFLTQNESIKIGDLGIARLFNSTSTEEVSTYVGTRAYMSPEIHENKKYSYNTDVWSIGCILYELITYEKFYIQYVETNHDIESIISNLNCDRNLRALMKKMLNKDPKDRIETHKLIYLIKKKNIDKKKDELICTLTGHSASVNCLVELRNGYLCSGSTDNTIKIWCPLEGKLIKTLTGHLDSVNCLAVLNNDLLCSGSNDKTINIWDSNKGVLFNTLHGHSYWVTCLTVLDNGYLCSASNDKTIKVWNALEKKLIHTLIGPQLNLIYSLIKLKNGYLCSSSSNDTICIWDPINGKLIKTITYDSLCAVSVTILKNDNFCFGSRDETIKVWSSKDEKLIFTLVGHSDWVSCLILTNDENYLVSGSRDETIKIWNLFDRNKLCLSLKAHSDWINCLLVLNNKYVCSGSNDKTIKVWDLSV